MNQPKLSIIVPIYKVEKYLDECLNSIFSQNVPLENFEVICVNDGTPDNSMQIVNRYAKKYSNLHIIEQENQGLSIARNNGLAASSGKYVWFVDSDDWLKPQAFATIIPLILEEKYDVISMPLDWAYPNPKNNSIDCRLEHDLIIDGITFGKMHLNLGAIQRNVISNDFLIKNNLTFYPHILHEDGLFGREMFYLAQKVYVLSKSYYNYRQREEGSIMHSIKIRSSWDLLTVHKQLVIFSEKYVKPEDKLWFKTEQTHILIDCLSFTWPLRKTQEYKNFLKATRKYRREQCLDCIKGNTAKNKIKLIIKAFYPIIYLHLDKFVGKHFRNH